MRESKVEDYLIDQVKKAGGETRKVKWIGRRDAPDRLVLMKNFACFVELKRPGKKPTERQETELGNLEAAGLRIGFIDNFTDVDELIRWGKSRA